MNSYNPNMSSEISPHILAQSNADAPIDIMPDAEIAIGNNGRHLAIFPARSGYELERELEFLSNRTLEQNIFFSGSFLAPAMPRLDNRNLKLLVIRDRSENRSRMRLLMPFSIEKPGFSMGSPIIRAWASPFGPLGTPLIDTENALETISDFIDGLSDNALKLPKVMVLPDIRLDSAFTKMLKGVAISKNLQIIETAQSERPVLQSDIDAPDYIEQSISKEHLRELKRQYRKLTEAGKVEYIIARQPNEIRDALEDFLHLENKGWKGKKKTSLVADHQRAAFAREAINNMAQMDRVRIHMLTLNGQSIASMIVFIMGGEAFTWKTCYDEDYAAYSPGKILVQQLTEWHLDDFNITTTDSCAVADHPIMARFWRERCRMGTLVIPLTPQNDRDARQVASQLHIYKNTRNLAKSIRDKVRKLAK